MDNDTQSNPQQTQPSVWDDSHWVWLVAILFFSFSLILQTALLLAPKVAFTPAVYSKIYALCSPNCTLPAKEHQKELLFLDSQIEQLSATYYKVSFTLENKAHYFVNIPWLVLSLKSSSKQSADTLWVEPSSFATPLTIKPFERMRYAFYIQSDLPNLEQFEINFAPQ